LPKKEKSECEERARAVGRVFALTSTETTRSGNLILEPYFLLGYSVLVMKD